MFESFMIGLSVIAVIGTFIFIGLHFNDPPKKKRDDGGDCAYPFGDIGGGSDGGGGDCGGGDCGGGGD